jgi:hypothetical protein
VTRWHELEIRQANRKYFVAQQKMGFKLRTKRNTRIKSKKNRASGVFRGKNFYGQISICKPVWLRYGSGMASITLKDIPVDLHAQLKQEADANYRSLNQEAMYRIARTFEIDDVLTSKRDQRLVDEALASGPETTLTKKDMDEVFKKVLKKAAK